MSADLPSSLPYMLTTAPPHPESLSTVQPRASTGTNSLQTVTSWKDGGHTRTHTGRTDTQFTCRRVTRRAPHHLWKCDTISCAHKLFFPPTPSLCYTHLLSPVIMTHLLQHVLSISLWYLHILCLPSLRSQLKELAVAVWVTDVKAPGALMMHLHQSIPLKSATVVCEIHICFQECDFCFQLKFQRPGLTKIDPLNFDKK